MGGVFKEFLRKNSSQRISLEVAAFIGERSRLIYARRLDPNPGDFESMDATRRDGFVFAIAVAIVSAFLCSDD